ncbi:hypothetical protein OH77DRAFT_730540 [Trametes cingulata]|nr:hypothetical protein OH77DRAFT_730540 [Trametes cingulata]
MPACRTREAARQKRCRPRWKDTQLPAGGGWDPRQPSPRASCVCCVITSPRSSVSYPAGLRHTQFGGTMFARSRRVSCIPNPRTLRRARLLGTIASLRGHTRVHHLFHFLRFVARRIVRSRWQVGKRNWRVWGFEGKRRRQRRRGEGNTRSPRGRHHKPRHMGCARE